MEYIWNFIRQNPGFTVLGAITLIQIAPIKIDPWTAVAHWLRRLLIGSLDDSIKALDKAMTERFSSVEKKIDRVEDTIEEREAVLARTHILRFNDELHNGIHHSSEYHLQTLDDIKKYEQYCEGHPDFANGRTAMATQNIKDTYRRLYEAHKI